MASRSGVSFGSTAPWLTSKAASAGPLWLFAIAIYGLGDLVSTLVGLQLGAAESNPIPAALIELAPGFLAVALVLTLYKALTLALFVAVAWRIPSPYASVIPATLCLIGVGVVGWNASVILTVAS